jgi:hypothetical protein
MAAVPRDICKWNVRQLFEKALAECGLDDLAAAHAMRILRSLVRGFVINEMSGSAAASADFDESFTFAMDVFLAGCPCCEGSRIAPPQITTTARCRP